MLHIVARLSLNAISKKTNKLNLRNGKKPSFEPNFGLFAPNSGRQLFFFFKNLTSSVTRYNGQLSSCTISEKTNDPILRKLSDGRCLTNVEHPKTNLKLKKT